jgi:hypothetical protein
MDVPRSTLEQAYDDIVGSSQYKLPWPVGPHPSDKKKVTRRRAGTVTPVPSGRLARAAWRLAALLAPAVTPPPPPPPVIRVAPITVTQQGGSDQRVCLFTGEVEGGPLRPGVSRITEGPNAGKYTDEHPGHPVYESNGLENTGVRTKLEEGAFGLVKAREMDNRNACQCPTAGDPLKNSGSWTP